MNRSSPRHVLLVVPALLLAGLLLAGTMPTGSVHGGTSLQRSTASTTGKASTGVCTTSVRCTPISPQRTPAPPQPSFAIAFIALAAAGLLVVGRRLGAGTDRRPPPGLLPSIFHPPRRTLASAA